MPKVSPFEAWESSNQLAMLSISAPNVDLEDRKHFGCCWADAPAIASESRMVPVGCDRFVSTNSFSCRLPMSSMMGTVTEPQSTSLRAMFWFQTLTMMLLGSSLLRTVQVAPQLGLLCAHLAAPVRCTISPST